jgi:hypothetical protein
MGARAAGAPRACIDLPIKDIYDVIIDIERRIHAVRILVGKLDRKTKLQFAEDAVAKGWKPKGATGQRRPIICNVCHPVQKWPPYRE